MLTKIDFIIHGSVSRFGVPVIGVVVTQVTGLLIEVGKWKGPKMLRKSML